MSNIVDAILNLANYGNNSLLVNDKGKNRANNMGDGLEEFIKDMFAGTFNMEGEERLLKMQETFSYLGNNSNPPDAMLKNGDALEVKKIETTSASLALNSSHPKHKLCVDDEMLSNACRKAEKWNEKDVIYLVGYVKKTKLKSLAMVYGMDYCADASCYLKLKNAIKQGVENTGFNFSESRELGHINKVDPLGITYMRVRGMWGIENPWKVFSYVFDRKEDDRMDEEFSMMCIIRKSKWDSFENKENLLKLSALPNFTIKDVYIRDPNNTALLNEAKLISFYFNRNPKE